MTCLVLPENLAIDVLPALVKEKGWLQTDISELDFSQVKRADSAVLSLVLFLAQKYKRPVKLTGMSEDLNTLVELYDLHSVIDITE